MSQAPGQSQTLYRKYRPRSFAADELVGQEHIARTLQNAIALDRVAHAYLFCGPRGTGKTSTARLLAKAVNCLHPEPMARPCNQCAACEAINNGSAVDIIEIDAASNRGVDDIRDLREKVKYAPTQLAVKFYIIDEAHQLTRDAFNAFLKTLEEPPPHVKFVLATTEPDKLPDTVASRCQRFDFRRVPLALMVEHLARICRSEGLEAEEEALRLVAQQATGSLRDAEGLIDQLALYDSQDGRPRITAEAARRMLGLSRGDRIARIVDALAERDTGAGLRLIAEAAESSEDIRQLNRQLVAYLRALLHRKAGGRESDLGQEAAAQAERFTLPELAEAVRAFSSIEAALNRGSYAQLPLELAFVDTILLLRGERAQMAALTPLSSPPRPRAAEPEPSRAVSPAPTPIRRESTQPTPPARPAPQPRLAHDEPPRSSSNGTANGHGASLRPAPPRPAPAAGSATVERLAQSWPQIRRDVKAANSRIAALLSSVDPVGVEGDQVILVSPYEFHRNKLNDDATRQLVEDVIARYLDGAHRLLCLAPDEARAHLRAQPHAIQEEVRPFEGEPEDAPEPQPVDAGDEEHLRAVKAIFNATELEPPE